MLTQVAHTRLHAHTHTACRDACTDTQALGSPSPEIHTFAYEAPPFLIFFKLRQNSYNTKSTQRKLRAVEADDSVISGTFASWASPSPVWLPDISLPPKENHSPPLLPSLPRTTPVLSAFRDLPILDISCAWNPTTRGPVHLVSSAGLTPTLKLREQRGRTPFSGQQKPGSRPSEILFLLAHCRTYWVGYLLKGN